MHMYWRLYEASGFVRCLVSLPHEGEVSDISVIVAIKISIKNPNHKNLIRFQSILYTYAPSTSDKTLTVLVYVCMYVRMYIIV